MILVSNNKLKTALSKKTRKDNFESLDLNSYINLQYTNTFRKWI